MSSTPATQILYDGDCPICQQAVCLLDTTGKPFVTINAREPSALREEATAAKVNLDQGFMIKHKGQLYAGAAAAHLLTTLVPAHGWRNRVTRFLFATPQRTRITYPLCRWARRIALAVRGKTLIRNIQTNEKCP
jgi:predicted DCC family thiol-disulfide oxidoreductase YuxK